VNLFSASEIQTTVLGKKNGITAPIVRSKQGLAAAIAGSCTMVEGRLAPPTKFRFDGMKGRFASNSAMAGNGSRVVRNMPPDRVHVRNRHALSDPVALYGIRSTWLEARRS
jgi:hypothetical protein